MSDIAFGQPIPRNLEYAVSFSIPTWDSALGYAKKNPELVSQMATGYPRFFPQPSVQELSNYFVQKFGKITEGCRPFPSFNSALQCLKFVKSITGPESTAHLEIEKFIFQSDPKNEPGKTGSLNVTVAVVLASPDEFEIVKEYWKLRGEILSSRLAASLNQYIYIESFISDLARDEFVAGLLLAKKKGDEAKDVIKTRIAGNHSTPFGCHKKLPYFEATVLKPDTDVHLLPSGMSTIFTAREILLFWEQKRSFESADGDNVTNSLGICDTVAVFGFLFKNTQVIMKTFGKSRFFGFGDAKDITELQDFLESSKQRILAVFVETPSNPLLNMPDLKELRRLADHHGFFIVIDDTIGGLNVDILGFADIICTSLTKLFNGSSNVMGGSLILNPKSSLYSYALDYLKNSELEDLLWCEDAIVIEENSRDYEERTICTNANTEKLLKELLLPEEGNIVKKIYYPTLSSKETLKNYEAVKNDNGGYGCLFSLAFYCESDAEKFYNSLDVFKGVSNGTNFTLVCPYVQIVHQLELKEVSEFGADPTLIRVSVGLEDFEWLRVVFSTAIQAVRRIDSQS